ncbi:MAG: nucleotide sugar dehydrogenase [Chloroflexota bacterium]|nr:nucleotide sugar dehydrogenase [Chloroflexota bacterium]PLS77079.1 MAG: UDP-N-acetyl-D-glucosamine dehydrogenase [Chloroflexota bacterium]
MSETKQTSASGAAVAEDVALSDVGVRLQARIEERTASIGVVGLGYVGVPLAVRAASTGFRVVGFDVLAERVVRISRGESYTVDVPSEKLGPLVASGQLAATTDFGRLGECDVIIICVPTPLDEHGQPDISYIEQSGTAIADTLRPGQLIVLESTTWPGTTDEVLLPKCAAQGLSVGQDFFLAFSPERIDPGQTNSKGWTVENTPKVVGGVTTHCTILASALYGAIVQQIVTVSSARTAEMTKLVENIFRNVNIALVNELALLCDRMELNIWEVLDAAATKPFAFMKHTPGPGLGGHCIPLDPFYLSWKAREYDFHTRFIELAGHVNNAMPYHVVTLVTRGLNKLRRSVNGSIVVALGVAYKPDIDDYRESPIFKIMELLTAEGAQVVPVDPHVATFYDHHGCAFQTTPLTDELLASADCVLIVTNHSVFDYERIVQLAPVVVDTRNATRDVREGRDKIVLL